MVGLCLTKVLALCFRDYQTTRFVHAGLICLAIGLLHAIPTGLLSWLVPRRGFAVDAISARTRCRHSLGPCGSGHAGVALPEFRDRARARLACWRTDGERGIGCAVRMGGNVEIYDSKERSKPRDDPAWQILNVPRI